MKFRVSHYPQIPCKAFEKEVSSLEEAKLLFDVLAEYDEFQYKNRIKPDYSNCTVLEQFNEETQEWEDWYDYDLDTDVLQEYFELKLEQLCEVLRPQYKEKMINEYYNKGLITKEFYEEILAKVNKGKNNE